MTVTAPPAPTRADDSAPIPLTRLARAEVRKLVDTRASLWLTLAIAGLSAIIMIVALAANQNTPENLTFGQLFGLMNIPTGIILPVLAIMLVTGEWSQRTALTTFTMEPRRDRIVAAKLVASLIAALGAVVVALVFAAIGTGIAGIAFSDPAGSWDMTAAGLFNSFLLQLFALLMGFGFAALLLNTPAAIVLYFVLPTVLSVVTELVPWFGDHLGDWVDTGRTQIPFMTGDWATGGEWARLLVSAVLWIGVPLVLGITRILRAEVK